MHVHSQIFHSQLIAKKDYMENYNSFGAIKRVEKMPKKGF